MNLNEMINIMRMSNKKESIQFMDKLHTMVINDDNLNYVMNLLADIRHEKNIMDARKKEIINEHYYIPRTDSLYWELLDIKSDSLQLEWLAAIIYDVLMTKLTPLQLDSFDMELAQKMKDKENNSKIR